MPSLASPKTDILWQGGALALWWVVEDMANVSAKVLPEAVLVVPESQADAVTEPERQAVEMK